jgi:hypothetical protein
MYLIVFQLIVAIKFIHNKYSIDTKIATQSELLKHLQEQTDLVEKYKNLGIEVTEEATEAMSKTFTKVTKNMYNIALSSPKIKINGELSSTKIEQQAQFMEQAKTVLLSSGEENS